MINVAFLETGSNGQAKVVCNDGTYGTFAVNQIAGTIEIKPHEFAGCIASSNDLPCVECARYAMEFARIPWNEDQVTQENRSMKEKG